MDMLMLDNYTCQHYSLLLCLDNTCLDQRSFISCAQSDIGFVRVSSFLRITNGAYNKSLFLMSSFARTLLANKKKFARTVPANKNEFAGTVPANKNEFAGTIPDSKINL